MFLAVLTAAVLCSQGCSGSSAAGGGTEEERPSGRALEEERRTDDKKVDLESISTRSPSRHYLNMTPPGVNRDMVLLDIVSLLGIPYRYGGADRDGMDCSAFTARVYEKSLSLNLPRSTKEQFREGRRVDPDSLQFGDLVFFNTTGSSPSHVGIYLEDDVFAHASVSFGVTLSSLESTYYRKRFVGARRFVR